MAFGTFCPWPFETVRVEDDDDDDKDDETTTTVAEICFCGKFPPSTVVDTLLVCIIIVSDEVGFAAAHFWLKNQVHPCGE